MVGHACIHEAIDGRGGLDGETDGCTGLHGTMDGRAGLRGAMGGRAGDKRGSAVELNFDLQCSPESGIQ